MSRGKSWRYRLYGEGGRDDPFSGMMAHAKWLLESELVSLMVELGFGRVDVAERRVERNGARVLVFASR
jgi:hypothetical protein